MIPFRTVIWALGVLGTSKFDVNVVPLVPAAQPRSGNATAMPIGVAT